MKIANNERNKKKQRMKERKTFPMKECVEDMDKQRKTA